MTFACSQTLSVQTVDSGYATTMQRVLSHASNFMRLFNIIWGSTYAIDYLNQKFFCYLKLKEPVVKILSQKVCMCVSMCVCVCVQEAVVFVWYFVLSQS